MGGWVWLEVDWGGGEREDVIFSYFGGKTSRFAARSPQEALFTFRLQEEVARCVYVCAFVCMCVCAGKTVPVTLHNYW